VADYRGWPTTRGLDLDQSVFATRVPPEVAEPTVRSSYAPIEEIGRPYHDKDIGGHDIESVPSAEREDDPDYPRPTVEEKSTLRRVAGNIPATSFALCVVEFSERASYYGVLFPFSNFMQLPLPQGGNGAGAPPRGTQQTAGALGKGLQFSNAFVLLFTFLAYVVPLFGAWVADTRLGRYKTIAIGVLVCGIAHLVLVIGAVPSVLQAGDGHSLPPFFIGFFFLAAGAGMYFSWPCVWQL
jgi:hypothetical protein